MIGRLGGALLIGLGMVGSATALLTALLLAVGGWTGGRVPWDGERVTDIHAVGWALVGAGLVGVGLRAVAARGWVAEIAGAAVLLGGVLAAIGLVAWHGSGASGWSPVHVTVPWILAGGIGGVGLVAAGIAGRARLEPLGVAVIAAGAFTALANGVRGFDAVRLTWALPPDMAVQLRRGEPLAVDPALSVVVAGVLAQALRAPGAGAALDRGVALALVLAAAGCTVGWTGGTLLAATFAALAYPVDGLRRGTLRPTLAQPVAVLALAAWSAASAWSAWDARLQRDVFLHDTFVGLAPGHLQAVALLAALLAGVAPDPAPGPSRWAPWAVAAGGCVAVAVAAGVLVAGFVALGLEGLPRRYWVYTDGAVGWGQLLAAVGLMVAGLAAAGLALGWEALSAPRDAEARR